MKPDFTGFTQFSECDILGDRDRVTWNKQKFSRVCINHTAALEMQESPGSWSWFLPFCKQHPEFELRFVALTTFCLYFENFSVSPYYWSCCKEVYAAIEEFLGYK